MTPDTPPLPAARLEAIYRKLFLIRRTEERVADIYPTDKIKSPVHLSIGQEAPSVGVCEALAPGDVAFGTYRGHALYLAKGGDLNAMLAELYGKATGCGKGKAGSMHLCAPQAGFMGTSAIVATTIPQAAGYAFAEKTRGRDTVVVVMFGDGAMEEGVFYETLNLAALFQLPLLFVCENNLYAIHTPFAKRVKEPNFCARAAAFGVATARVEKNDVLQTQAVAAHAVRELRAGRGPFFLEVETYRWREHVGPNEDWDLGYRTRAEAEPWMRNDELTRIGALLDPARRAAIEHETLAAIEAAFAHAEASPFPAPAALHEHVWAGAA